MYRGNSHHIPTSPKPHGLNSTLLTVRMSGGEQEKAEIVPKIQQFTCCRNNPPTRILSHMSEEWRQ